MHSIGRVGAALFVLLLCATIRADAPKSPVPAEDTLALFQLHPACRIELVACEPDVLDPVHIAFDSDGRIWVVEYSDYPNGPADGQPGTCRIRVLTDDDGDGRYTDARTFADQLRFATGLMHWKDGVLVTTNASLLFLRDADGDGRADEQEEWFRGFKTENPQLRANHPTFALDNHIYVASGLRGGEVIATKKEWAEGAKPVSLSGRDFRFDPLTGKYEAVSGVGQFGVSFDDWGNRFICSNRNPCDHVVLEDWYHKRNPHVAVPRVVENVSPAAEKSRVFPISRFWTTSNLHAGTFTAACGLCIYRGDALPEEFYGNSFIGEPTGNLVHRDVLNPWLATFASKYDRPGVEFLATRDEWFRPVNLSIGPDGALYVVDMYRAVIEHPQFMPEELQKRSDLLLGSDRGRIYRIVSRDVAAPRGKAPRLSGTSSAELVELLSHPNGWWRETAHRLLFERHDASATTALKRSSIQAASAPARAHSLWLLDGLAQLDRDVVLAALHDTEPRVVEQAVRLAEARFPADEAIVERVLAVARTTFDTRLAFQCALSLGAFPPSAAVDRALAHVVLLHGDDPWVRTAVILGAGPRAGDVLVALLDQDAALRTDRGECDRAVRALAELVGATGDPDEMELCLQAMTKFVDPGHRGVWLACVLGLAAGYQRPGRNWADLDAQWSVASARQLKRVFEEAAAGFVNPARRGPPSDEGLALMEFAPWELVRLPLMAMATRSPVVERRTRAIDVLGRRSEPEVVDILLMNFSAQTPAVKPSLLAACSRAPARVQRLFDEIEAGRISAREIDPVRANQFRNHRDASVRERARTLLEVDAAEDRQKVLADYQPALTLRSDHRRGREVFVKNCVQCHRIADVGVNVAPDISDSRVKKPEQLLADILDPNRAIDNNYFSYSVVDTDGGVHTGVIAAETATSITLRQPEGKEVTLLRRNIAELKSSGVSLMPAGLEQKITVQEMADLISFIKNWRYLDGSVPPEVIR